MTNSNNQFGVFKTVTLDHSDTPPDLHSTVRRPLPKFHAQSSMPLVRRSLVEGLLLDCKVTGRSLATIEC